jgi:hypothetical protein
MIVLVVVEFYKKQHEDWIILKTRDFMKGVSYYDRNIMKNAVNNNPQVRIKTVYADESREFFINFIVNFIAKDMSESALDGFSYMINQDELDCKAKKYKLLSTTLYDDKNTILYSTTYQKKEWKDIPPKSDLEELAEHLCNYTE